MKNNKFIATIINSKPIAPIIAIGVIVIAFATFTDSVDKIISFLEKRLFKTQSQNIEIVETNSGTSTPSNKNRSEADKLKNTISLSPLEIIQMVQKRPPLQREDATKHYTGLWAEWDLHLGDIWKYDTDTVNLILDAGEYFTFDSGVMVPVLISCSVSLSENKKLALLEEGAPIKVFGRITNIKDITIKLDDVKLEIQ